MTDPCMSALAVARKKTKSETALKQRRLFSLDFVPVDIRRNMYFRKETGSNEGTAFFDKCCRHIIFYESQFTQGHYIFEFSIEYILC